jgi:[protein-PII] uridylyltransferase
MKKIELSLQIENLIAQNSSDFEVALAIKGDINNYYLGLKDKFKANQGKDFLVKHTKYTDLILKQIYKYVLRKYFKSYIPFINFIPISLVALGSYGREQLCLYSDIDLMIVYEDIEGYNILPIIENILQISWDSGLELGHRVHAIDDLFVASKKDATIKSSILESRFIYGSNNLFFKVNKELKRISNDCQKEFVIAKLQEYKNRHKKQLLKMEPNIKEGIGGLRDTNTLFWLAIAKYSINSPKELMQKSSLFKEDEYKTYRASLEFMFRVRSALHFSAGKKQDILTFDFVSDVAKKLSIKGNRYKSKETKLMELVFIYTMKIYKFCNKYINIISNDILNTKQPLITTSNHKLYVVKNIVYLQNNINNIEELLEELNNLKDVSLVFDNSVNSSASHLKTSLLSKETKKLFLNILNRKHSFNILMFFYKNELLEVLIKEFKYIKFLAQFDGFHQLPVCLHSIECIWHVENIQDEKIQYVYKSLSTGDKLLLKLAIIFHDLGKGKKEEHSIVGSKIFLQFAKRYKFDEEDTQKIRLLIRYHVLMSSTAIKEDIYNEKVIFSFVSQLKTKTVIDMLYVLTYADINGTSSSLFTGHTSKLLQSLHTFSIEALNNKELIEESYRRKKKEKAILKSINNEHFTKLTRNKILAIDSNLLFLKYSKEQIIELVKLTLETKNFKYRVTNNQNLRIEIVRAAQLNLGYLLGKLSFLDIVNMDIFRLFDNKKFFHIEFSSSIDKSQIQEINKIIEDSFDMTKKIVIKNPEIRKRDIFVDCNHSNSLAKMQINTKNTSGLFAYVAKTFDDFGIEIESAKIYTQKNRAKDLFLIEKNGKFCSNIDKITNCITIEN